MTDRRTARGIRTDRPGRDLTPGRLTVGDVLELEPLRAGNPQVMAGRASLERVVRWLHVAESPTAASFLEGGELVLTTGTAWPQRGHLTAHTEALLDAGAVGLVIELGSRFARVPVEVQQVCERRRAPLIALQEQVRFVAVTEAAHRLLVASQVAALQARDEVQALFSELNRAGAPADHIVAEVAQLAGSPVVLEDLAHRVVCCAPHDRPESEVLQDWSRRSRSGSTQQDGQRVVDVAARGRRWGRLVAVSVPSHMSASAIDLVLTQGALALSLGAMAATTEHGSSWETIRQRRALEAVLERRFTSGGHLVQVLQAAGLHVQAGPVAAVGWTVGRESGTDTPGWTDRARETATRVAGPLRAQLACAPVATVPGGMLGLLVLPPGSRSEAPGRLVEEFVDRLRAGPVPVDVTTAGRLVTPTGGEAEQLLASLGEARDLLETARPGARGLLRARGTEIDQLTRAVPGPRMQEFVEELIGPLLSYDARHGTDLLAVLEAYLRHPGNRTRAARESHLSRSVFYQRLELMESQLGRDLHDGSTLAALHVAISAHRRSAERPHG